MKNVYLCLGYDRKADQSVQYQFYDIEDESGDDLLLIQNSIPSPPKASITSMMTVVGKRLYIVGGSSNIAGTYDFPGYADVYSFDLADCNAVWKQCHPLIVPRSSPQLFVEGGYIYALGGHLDFKDAACRIPSPTDHWAEIYSTELDQWSPCEVTHSLTHGCKSFPWTILWCVLNTSNVLVFYAFDNDNNDNGDLFKLYAFDLSTREVGLFDKTFQNNFAFIAKSPDTVALLGHSPAHHQRGDNIYFVGQKCMYSYCLTTNKWNLVDGFHITQIGNEWAYGQLNLEIVNLGSQNFGAIWFDPKTEIIYWTKFMLSDIGPPKAFNFSAPQKSSLRIPCIEFEFAGLECFVVNSPNSPTEEEEEYKYILKASSKRLKLKTWASTSK